MQTKLVNDSSPERYVVEIDGIATAEYCVFVKALSASLRLKQEFPELNSSGAAIAVMQLPAYQTPQRPNEIAASLARSPFQTGGGASIGDVSVAS